MELKVLKLNAYTRNRGQLVI